MLLTSSQYLLPENFSNEFYNFGDLFTYIQQIVDYLTDSVQSVGAFVSYIISSCPDWLKYCFGFCLAYLILLGFFRLLKEL